MKISFPHQDSLRESCVFCRNCYQLVGSPPCFAGVPSNYGGGPADAIAWLNRVIVGRAPITCIQEAKRYLVAAVGERFLSGVLSIIAAIDELSSGQDIVSVSYETETAFPPLHALVANLLSKNHELRRDQGQQVRVRNRRCIEYLQIVSARTPDSRPNTAQMALLMAGRSMLDLADGNIAGAVEFSRRAVITARTSHDNRIHRIALHVQASAFDAMGHAATARMLRGMANRLVITAGVPIWLHPALWITVQEDEMEVRKAA